MFDHISLKVRDFGKSLAFYKAALAPLGCEPQHIDEAGKSAGFGPKGNVRLWIAEGGPHGSTHLAFESPDQAAVARFYEAAVRSGGRDNGKPGLRPDYATDYYAAFVLDPDGNNVEAVAHLSTTSRHSSLIAVLHSPRPAADKMSLYGRFIGDWTMSVVAYEANGAKHEGRGEIHFGWVLEGRAIQDVWMIPPRTERTVDAPVMPVAGNWYGTTLRVYDPAIDAWHITWIDPANRQHMRQVGRARGPDIVQEGTSDNGVPTRWSFTEITDTSFHWLGELSADKGKTWRLQVEVFATRVAAA
jgi:catechol 2,3-dioxygenase-like lactoylglutathione lyase family enzyme